MEDSIALEGFRELFPEKNGVSCSVRYKKRMKGYSASIAYSRASNLVEFRLGRGWMDVSQTIKKGLFQELLVKIFKKKSEKIKPTMEMELYSNFVKNLHLSVSKSEAEPLLEQSFERVNDSYFSGLLEKPNMRFSGVSFRKLARYDYQEDMITVSEIFRDAKPEMLDYLIYHELLHKKMKFSYKNGKNYHHTRSFKKMEEKFENAAGLEKEFGIFIAKKRRELSRKTGFLSIFR